MISLSDKLNLEGYGLLLQNNELTITKTLKNEYIVIDDNLTINILKDVEVNILDISSNKEIFVNIDENSSVNYQIINSNGAEVATVSKELFNWTDTYSIDVYNPQDALNALMLVLAIDAEKCSRRN